MQKTKVMTHKHIDTWIFNVETLLREKPLGTGNPKFSLFWSELGEEPTMLKVKNTLLSVTLLEDFQYIGHH